MISRVGLPHGNSLSSSVPCRWPFTVEPGRAFAMVNGSEEARGSPPPAERQLPDASCSDGRSQQDDQATTGEPTADGQVADLARARPRTAPQTPTLAGSAQTGRGRSTSPSTIAATACLPALRRRARSGHHGHAAQRESRRQPHDPSRWAWPHSEPDPSHQATRHGQLGREGREDACREMATRRDQHWNWVRRPGSWDFQIKRLKICR